MDASGSDANVAARFLRQARCTPGAVALTDGANVLTYARLADEAASVARLLGNAGVAGGSLVGLSVSRGWRVLAGILGIWIRRCAYVPIDPAYPAPRRDLITVDARVACIVADGADGGISLAAAEPAGPPHAVPPSAAYVIYTSGSTGRPKGVVVTHDNLTALLDGAAQVLPALGTDTGTVFHSYCFDFSVWEIWRLLTVGGRCVYVPADLTLDAARFARLLADEHVRVLNLVPSVFANLVRTLEKRPVALPSLREIIFGGEPLNIGAVRRWHDLALAPAAALVNMYGITETTVHVTAKRLDTASLTTAGGTETPIGKPLPHLQVVVLDEDGEPVADGVTGEMHVAGAGVSVGYLGQPSLTGSRFVRHAFDGRQHRWYRSGDLARRAADRELHFVGRCDDQVQLRGHRIEPGEIEATLRTAPGVADCAVLVVPNGRGNPVLVACYVPENGASCDERTLRTMLSDRLPRYMVPVKLAAIGKLPVTPEGKLNRTLLNATAAQLISGGS